MEEEGVINLETFLSHHLKITCNTTAKLFD